MVSRHLYEIMIFPNKNNLRIGTHVKIKYNEQRSGVKVYPSGWHYFCGTHRRLTQWRILHTR